MRKLGRTLRLLILHDIADAADTLHYQYSIRFVVNVLYWSGLAIDVTKSRFLGALVREHHQSTIALDQRLTRLNTIGTYHKTLRTQGIASTVASHTRSPGRADSNAPA
jgi:hypothetical protein